MEELINQLASSVSKTIRNSIEDLADDLSAPKRWVWELLQNAVDISVSIPKENIAIKYTLDSNRVVFQHNGIPFDKKNLISFRFLVVFCKFFDQS